MPDAAPDTLSLHQPVTRDGAYEFVVPSDRDGAVASLRSAVEVASRIDDTHIQKWAYAAAERLGVAL